MRKNNKIISDKDIVLYDYLQKVYRIEKEIDVIIKINMIVVYKDLDLFQKNFQIYS